jgi:hypothetical protein
VFSAGCDPSGETDGEGVLMTSLLIFFSAMFLHELGHASMALVLGVKCYRIEFKFWHGIPYGLGLSRDMNFNRFLEGCITVAGTIYSLAFMLWACVMGYNEFALANLALLTIGSLHDYYRLFMFSGLRTKALINRYLMAVCHA